MSNHGCCFAVLCATWLTTVAAAAELQVRVLDREGRPVTNVVVAAVDPQQPRAPIAPRVKTAVMDQIDKQFVPHVLVVQAGTAVTFPNSDTVAHQVYSFSPVKRFQLPLYHGQPHSPLVFADPGIVVLGCNIHDNMIGYIYVAPTPHFGKTDASGTVTLTDLAPGAYELSVWNPRFNEPNGQIRQTVRVDAGSPATLEVRLKHALRPETRSGPTSYGY